MNFINQEAKQNWVIEYIEEIKIIILTLANNKTIDNIVFTEDSFIQFYETVLTPIYNKIKTK